MSVVCPFELNDDVRTRMTGKVKRTRLGKNKPALLCKGLLETDRLLNLGEFGLDEAVVCVSARVILRWSALVLGLHFRRVFMPSQGDSKPRHGAPWSRANGVIRGGSRSKAPG